MAITVKVLADSIAPCGKRLTTMEWKYPRGIHSEIMTHGMLARNSASSRAIPTPTLIQTVLDDPFVPEYIGANKSGMQAGDELTDDQKAQARYIWLASRDEAVERARQLVAMGVHKQVVNRIIEPWMWITIIVSATEWDNVWGLRCHPMAEPHFQKLAYMARDAMAASTPRVLKAGEWHLPLTRVDKEDIAAIARYTVETHTTPEERTGIGLGALAGGSFEDKTIDASGSIQERLKAAVTRVLIKVSVGRCARVSYLTHEGKREIEKDIELHDRLVGSAPLHASPAEHVAQAMDYPQWYRDWAPRDATLPPLQEIQERVLVRREQGGEFVQEHMIEEAVLAQMRSGKFFGWRQYRKTLSNEHIGGRMP